MKKTANGQLVTDLTLCGDGKHYIGRLQTRSGWKPAMWNEKGDFTQIDKPQLRIVPPKKSRK